LQTIQTLSVTFLQIFYHSHTQLSNFRMHWQIWLTKVQTNIYVLGVTRRQGFVPPKFLVYIVILCFEKRRPKQKYC